MLLLREFYDGEKFYEAVNEKHTSFCRMFIRQSRLCEGEKTFWVQTVDDGGNETAMVGLQVKHILEVIDVLG